MQSCLSSLQVWSFEGVTAFSSLFFHTESSEARADVGPGHWFQSSHSHTTEPMGYQTEGLCLRSSKESWGIELCVCAKLDWELGFLSVIDCPPFLNWGWLFPQVGVHTASKHCHGTGKSQAQHPRSGCQAWNIKQQNFHISCCPINLIN